jgi:hypothetical protein
MVGEVMQIDLKALIKEKFEYKFSRIRFLKDELRTAYKDKKTEIEREIFLLSIELRDEVDNLKFLANELNEEINLVNKL